MRPSGKEIANVRHLRWARASHDASRPCPDCFECPECHTIVHPHSKLHPSLAGKEISMHSVTCSVRVRKRAADRTEKGNGQ